jgi:hypothetical protein
MATINNKIYLSGISANELSPSDKVLDGRVQGRIVRLLNSSMDRFTKRLKNDPSLYNLVCESEEIMNRFNARKASIK